MDKLNKVVGYDENGQRIWSFSVRTEVVTLADAPAGADGMIHEAHLIVARYADGTAMILKNRSGLLDAPADAVLAELRANPLVTVPADALVNDQRPPVDGTQCPWRGYAAADTLGKTMGCNLDTGHEGEHNPVPL